MQSFSYYFFICELKHRDWIYYSVSHESPWGFKKKKKSTYPEILSSNTTGDNSYTFFPGKS